MRLGLLADIHEAVEPLRAAVRELAARRVDAYVMLGDAIEDGARVDETVEILSALPGPGVWGNHDFGLCGEVPASVSARFSPRALEYFGRLRPWVDLAGCRFQHVDPHLDPEDIVDLWGFSTLEQRIEGMRRCTHSRVVTGHLHDWGLFTPERQVRWIGEGPFSYRPDERYLTIVHAVCEGWCAILDTGRDELVPIRVAAPVSLRGAEGL